MGSAGGWGNGGVGGSPVGLVSLCEGSEGRGQHVWGSCRDSCSGVLPTAAGCCCSSLGLRATRQFRAHQAPGKPKVLRFHSWPPVEELLIWQGEAVSSGGCDKHGVTSGWPRALQQARGGDADPARAAAV